MLDSKLFKALRAGGLGHKAAALLADQDSRYGIGQKDGITTDADYQTLVMQMAGVILGQTYAPPWADAIYFPTVLILPMTAGQYIQFRHYGSDAFGSPDGDLELTFHKLADANGIPVTPVRTAVSFHRSSNAFSPVEADNGWTFVAQTSYQVSATQAAAGWYSIGCDFFKSA